MKNINDDLPFENLVDVIMHFSDEQVCKDYLVKIRWGSQIVCPHCSHDGKIYKMKKSYKCSKCRKPFSVTKGTIFENSPIPLQKWFAAIWLITSHKKGISSVQLHKDLGITQKSAWFLLQRVRSAIINNSLDTPLNGVVEIDETYIGGKGGKEENTQGRSLKTKKPVLGLVERGGRIVAMKVDNTTKGVLLPIIKENVSDDVELITDGWRSYSTLGDTYKHTVVKHNKNHYTYGEAHTNTIEGFWSLLKRGIVGIYHSISEKHMNYYINEFNYRYNTREMTCIERFNDMLGISECRTTYRDLVA